MALEQVRELLAKMRLRFGTQDPDVKALEDAIAAPPAEAPPATPPPAETTPAP